MKARTIHHSRDRVDLFRVAVVKSTTQVQTKRLAKWTEIEE